MKSIKENLQKINLQTLNSDIVTIALIVLVGLSSFGLGRLSIDTSNKEPVQILYPEITASANAAVGGKNGDSGTVIGSQEGLLVGSKNGSKYHFPWCSGAQRMKEENKIWFATIEDAKKAGYTPAGNCKGLE